MKISLLQCCLIIIMLQLSSNMADGTPNGEASHQVPSLPNQELQDANLNASLNSSEISRGNEHTEGKNMLSYWHKNGRRGAGGGAFGTAIGQIAHRRHRHGSNAPPPVSLLRRLAVDAILISLSLLIL